ncbi:Pheromone/general odorant binding protein [Cinara cedri]|uniref:Pheromone/general odorant binding protein n=1 Tax=Cinara cedri TaxID=506608 RepID=A0A5E4M4H7_9HEMI|nr:Pheromone/general odorant binding protein [Cinara cedri]
MQRALQVFCACLAAAITVFATRVTGLEKLNDIIASQRGNDDYEDVISKCRTETESSAATYYNKPSGETTLLITRKDQCLLACLMRKYKIIVTGRLQKEELIRVVQAYYQNNLRKKQFVNYVIETCAKKVQWFTDECTLAGALTICVTDESKKYYNMLSRYERP